jgi:hypothetical protein
MGPPSKKRASSVLPHSDSKRAATGVKKGVKGKASTKPAASKLSSLGFLSTKRWSYQLGTKILLSDKIYDMAIPENVKGHMFVYKIVEWYKNGKEAKIE